MQHYQVDMSVDYKALGFAPPETNPKLTTYILTDDPLTRTIEPLRPAVIICPGGGYTRVSSREAEPVALRYNAAGFHAFVLDYSVAPTGWPVACCELSKAIAYVRSIADEHHIDKNKIVVCGFSAGGHLAASIGVHYDKEIVKQYSGITEEENKPNGMILAYPVIVNGEHTHPGTKERFLAGRGDDVEQFYGLDEHVTCDTPKTFLWHTYTDKGVMVENSLHLALALRKHGVSLEMHIFSEGEHGLSLANELTATDPSQMVPSVQPWVDLSIAWIKRL